MVNVSGGHLCWDRMPPNPLATARHVQPLQPPHAAKPQVNQYNQIVFHQVLILAESSSCLPCSPTPTLAMEVASLHHLLLSCPALENPAQGPQPTEAWMWLEPAAALLTIGCSKQAIDARSHGTPNAACLVAAGALLVHPILGHPDCVVDRHNYCLLHAVGHNLQERMRAMQHDGSTSCR